MPRHRCAILLALGAAALLGGCGGGEPATVADRDATLRVAMTEFRFAPQNLEVQATKIPMKVHVVARNKGKLTHNLVIQSEDAAAEQGVASAPPTVFLQTATAQPRATVSGNAYLQPGTYRITDTIGNHDNLGQYGKLVVKAPKPPG